MLIYTKYDYISNYLDDESLNDYIEEATDIVEDYYEGFADNSIRNAFEQKKGYVSMVANGYNWFTGIVAKHISDVHYKYKIGVVSDGYIIYENTYRTTPTKEQLITDIKNVVNEEDPIKKYMDDQDNTIIEDTINGKRFITTIYKNQSRKTEIVQ